MYKIYYIYIATNQRDTVLYTGITSNLERRMQEHKLKMIKGFTKKYNVDKLVYYETFDSPFKAIAREKEIKGWTRIKKEMLIEKMNPKYQELINEHGILRIGLSASAQDDNIL
jgi:putative endonuclease